MFTVSMVLSLLYHRTFGKVSVKPSLHILNIKIVHDDRELSALFIQRVSSVKCNEFG